MSEPEADVGPGKAREVREVAENWDKWGPKGSAFLNGRAGGTILANAETLARNYDEANCTT